ncbi:hypothetical protein N9903_01460 [bacterium]|nr:hypothetical protein [bacterium]
MAVGVQPGEDVAGGTGKAFADGFGRTVVLFRYNRRYSGPVPLDDIHGTVGAPAVDHDVLDIEPLCPLGQDAPQGLLEKFLSVEIRGDNTELHGLHCP